MDKEFPKEGGEGQNDGSEDEVGKSGEALPTEVKDTGDNNERNFGDNDDGDGRESQPAGAIDEGDGGSQTENGFCGKESDDDDGKTF